MLALLELAEPYKGSVIFVVAAVLLLVFVGNAFSGLGGSRKNAAQLSQTKGELNLRWSDRAAAVKRPDHGQTTRGR
jgi:hypothetical protein